MTGSRESLGCALGSLDASEQVADLECIHQWVSEVVIQMEAPEAIEVCFESVLMQGGGIDLERGSCRGWRS